jgi:uncharacterized phage protein (TIGR02218 family)
VKTLTPHMAAAIAGPVTTLCRAYVATRADGTVYGFTDHDRDLVVAGITCRAATGVTATEVVAVASLSVGGQDIVGALASDAIAEADIASGLWDGAEVRSYLVDWTMPAEALHLATAHLGEVTRRDGAFAAELRSLAQALDQPKGRLYQHRCDADLGDIRCGVALDGLAMAGAIVTVARGRYLIVAGISDAPARRFAGGTLRADGRRFSVKADGDAGDGLRAIELWDIADALAAGDAVTLLPGCDKRFEICRERFGNGLNFRGFPHIPGSDFVLAHPAATSLHDGGALMP